MGILHWRNRSLNEKKNKTNHKKQKKKNFMSDTETESENEEKEIKTIWQKYVITKSEKALFEGPPKLIWMASTTDARGCCSVDTIAVAFNLPRTPSVWSRLRIDVAASNHTGIRNQLTKLRPYEHLETDDVAYLALTRFDTIPIIIHNDAAMKQQGGLRFAITSLLYSEMKRIKLLNKKQDLQTRYIVIQYLLYAKAGRKPDAFSQHGVGHFLALGAKTTEKSKEIKTLFMEDELPKSLLNAFEDTVEMMRDFYTMPLSERRQKKEKFEESKQKDAIVIEQKNKTEKKNANF